MMEKEIMEKKTSDKNSAYEYELLKQKKRERNINII